jgi:hypothetical protein
MERGGHLRHQFGNPRFDRAFVLPADTLHVQRGLWSREQSDERIDQTVVAGASGCGYAVVPDVEYVDARDQAGVEPAEIE